MKTLKKQSVIILSLLISFVVLFTSCKSDENDNPPPEENDFSENWGAMVSRDFMGKIVDENDNPLSDVQVEIGNDMTTTDDNGIFIINGATVYERFAYITAKKAGYINMSRAMIPKSGTNYADIKAMAEELVNTVASGADSESTLTDGTTVKLDGEFKDEDGNAYSGNVSVYMHHLSPSDTNIERTMPGMLYAQNTNNEERMLETYGMVNVELRGSGGEKLNIADGHTATIEIPIDASQPNAPNTIELWHFDEEKGYWIEDGIATKIGNKYVGEVSHFSWWNCDAQFPTVDLCMTIEDTNGNPIYGVQVVLTPNGMNPRYGFSNGNGEICGLIPSNTSLEMEIFDPCGSLISTSNIGPFSSNTDIGVVTIPAAQTSVISGTLLDCNNNPVTDGYVTLNYNNIELLYTVTNGSFEFNTTTCVSLTNFTLEGVDFNGFQSSDVMNYTFTPPTTNIGNLLTCNGIPEYITYQVNNNDPITFVNGFSASLYLGGVSVGSQSNGNYFHMEGDATTPGVYNSPNFDIGADIAGRDPSVATNIQFVLSNFGAVGDYIDMTFTGTYTHFNGDVNTITGTIHVLRDN
jgi:hypothetical protein